MKGDPFEAPVPSYVGWAVRREEVLPTLARVREWWAQWEFMLSYGDVGVEAEAWLEERERKAQAERLVRGFYEAMARDAVLVDRLKAAVRLKEKLLSGELKPKPAKKTRPVRGSRARQVRGARLKEHILIILREVDGPMLVRDIVGVIEDRTGRAVSESAVSHSLLRMSREKPALVRRVRRGWYVALDMQI